MNYKSIKRLIEFPVLVMILTLSGCVTPASNGHNETAVREHPEQYLVLAVQNDVAAAPHIGSTLHGYNGDGSYTQSARARLLLKEIANDYRLRPVASWPIQVLSMQCVIFRRPDNISSAELIDKLQHDARVLLAEPLQSFDTNTTASVTSKESYELLQSSLQRMDVSNAHRWSRGQGVHIAVIDTGMDVTHPDLQGHVSIQRNFVDADNARFLADRHGTAVAGVMSADVHNHTGIIGIAPEARLIALKACWQLKVDNDDARCNSFTLAQALASAIELHTQIINLSVVGPADPLLAALIKQAQTAGIIVVGAADSNGVAAFPAQLPNVIGVTAMEQAPKNAHLLYAPGRDVLTLLPGGHYDFSSGSSIATAEISGIIALLLAVHNDGMPLDIAHLQALLLQSTETSATDNLSSVNACWAITQLLKQNGCSNEPSTMAHNAAFLTNARR